MADSWTYSLRPDVTRPDLLPIFVPPPVIEEEEDADAGEP